MPDQTKCSRCGAPLGLAVSGGLCLGCLLRFGLKDELPEEPADGDQPPAPAISSDGGLDELRGRYRLVGKIGEGGCGIVYRAEQLEPVRRVVALKVIKLGMDTRNVIARFEAERQALALMDHPGIARVLDAGSTSTGRPYFVMELVVGEPITRYCARQQLNLPQRLELFVEICQAVQHAHQKGIIHRDLKPSNILVTAGDGRPRPKVIDFGVAKATSRQRLGDDTLYTAFDQFVGTPAYMSPEQAGLTGEDVDTRSDIYSLGVLLYELLTGRPPFDPERLRQAALTEVCRIIRDEESPRPSTQLAQAQKRESRNPKSEGAAALRLPPSAVDRDLDWIVMKALEKDRTRRYETANGLARDIQRLLANEPVTARPPGTWYRFQKVVRRNKVVVGAGLMVFLALALGVAVATRGYFKEKAARQQAVAAETAARAQAVRSEQVATLLKDMLASAGPSVARGRDPTLLREILDQAMGRVRRELVDNPEVEAELLATIGRTYYDLKELDPAEAASREVLRLRESAPGATNPALADALQDLAIVLNTRAEVTNLVEAERLLRRALAIRRANVNGRDDLPLAETMQLLAWNQWTQQRLAEAESLHRQSLAIRERRLPPDDPAIVASLSALALVLSSDPARIAEAESCARRAVARQQTNVPADDPARIEPLSVLAIVLDAAGKPAEAERAEREGIRIRTKLLGEDNETMSGALSELAVELEHQGKYAEAEQASRQAIALQKKFRGNEHPHLANFLFGTLVQILNDEQKWSEVEQICREWVPLLRKVSPERKDTLLDALGWQANAFVAQGKWAEAEPPAREALALCHQLHETNAPAGGPTTTRCQGLRRMLGEVLLHLHPGPEAEALLRASYEGLKDHPGKWERIDCEKSLVELVELYEATGQPEQAEAWKQRLATFRAAASGP